MTRKSKVVEFIKANGPSTPRQIFGEVAKSWTDRSVYSELSRLRRNKRIQIVGQVTEPGRPTANLWGLYGTGVGPKPATPNLVEKAIAAQPELARVWSAFRPQLKEAA